MDKKQLLKELIFKNARSSGPGGQHVNKVSTKVVLYFDVNQSEGLASNEKKVILEKLAKRITSEDKLILECEETRSQLRNKEKVITKFFELLDKAFYVPKKRLATKPTKASVKQKLDQKKRRGELKKSRQKPRF